MLIDLDRAQAILRRQEIDVLLSNRPEHITYVSGVADNLECRFMREQWTYALIFSTEAPALVVPWFEVPYLQSKSEVGAIIPNQAWVEAPSPENPTGVLQGSAEAAVAAVIRERHLAAGRIGIDERVMSLAAFQQLQAVLPKAQFAPATSTFEEIRLLKTAEELWRIEKAVQAVEQGYQAIEAHLREGVTERELTLKAQEAILAAGADDMIFNFVTTGVRTGIDHVTGDTAPIKAGGVVKCDIGAHYRGYCSDIGRSFACGDPAIDRKRIYRRIRETEKRVIAAAKPGVTGSELYGIYLDGMRDGYGDLPWDMIGHGIGLEVHERPVIGPLERRPLQPGMVLCVEIGYLDPGRHGFHLEDMILITEDGHRPLSSLRKDYIS